MSWKYDSHFVNCLRPAIALPCRFSYFLSSLQVALQCIRFHKSADALSDSRILPHMVYLVQSTNLGEPRAHWCGDFTPGIDSSTPVTLRSTKSYERHRKRINTRLAPKLKASLEAAGSCEARIFLLVREAELWGRTQTLG